MVPSGLYPDCPATIRTVDLGGVSKPALLLGLQRNAISLNEYAKQLFASALFTTSATRYSLTTVELTVANLGFPRGATTADVFERAAELGLCLCPVELGPHLRLQYLDQAEGHVGHPVRTHRAPYGSVTIASAALTDDDDFPKGFYLRRIEGVLWLRGYRSGPEQLWDTEDHLVFRQT